MSWLKLCPKRSEPYRRWVATLPCVRCGIAGYSQAAHPNHGRGLGQKADDIDCFPLCADRVGIQGCHSRHDQLKHLTREERRMRERLYTARTQELARLAGRKELT